MDFLADNNACGQTLLRLVSRGNAIIAEILRLSEFVPPAYRLEGKEQGRHADILFDFSYFKSAEFYDNKIETNVVSFFRLIKTLQYALPNTLSSLHIIPIGKYVPHFICTTTYSHNFLNGQ